MRFPDRRPRSMCPDGADGVHKADWMALKTKAAPPGVTGIGYRTPFAA